MSRLLYRSSDETLAPSSRRATASNAVGKVESDWSPGDSIVGLTSDRAKKIIESVDERDITKASLSQKAVAFGIFVDKRQILSGEPTQRLSIDDHRKLDEIAVLIYQEMQRRGITAEIDPVTQKPRLIDAEYDEEPDGGEGACRVRSYDCWVQQPSRFRCIEGRGHWTRLLGPPVREKEERYDHLSPSRTAAASALADRR